MLARSTATLYSFSLAASLLCLVLACGVLEVFQQCNIQLLRLLQVAPMPCCVRICKRAESREQRAEQRAESEKKQE
jgi:hypothetical protein